jgi:hypothetical protein
MRAIPFMRLGVEINNHDYVNKLPSCDYISCSSPDFVVKERQLHDVK